MICGVRVISHDLRRLFASVCQKRDADGDATRDAPNPRRASTRARARDAIRERARFRRVSIGAMATLTHDASPGRREREIKITLKRATPDARGENADVAVRVRSLDVDVGTLKRRFVVNAVWDAPNAESVVLIYGGKVLRDDETLRDAFARGRESVAAYGETAGEGDGRTEMATVDESGTEGEARAAEEYVVHIVVRSARETSAEDSRATTTTTAEGAVNARGGEGDAREEGGHETAVPASEARETTATRGDARDAGASDPGTPAMFRGDVSANAFASPVSMFREDAPRASHGALEHATSPLMNATYQAAYYAAFAALSPSSTPPGPPPLVGVGNFLRVDAASSGEHAANERTGVDDAQQRQRMENGLPPELNIPPGARVRVIHIRIDLKLILKLAMMVFFMSQDASAAKTAMYVGVAILVYLQQTGALAPVARWITGNDNIGRNGLERQNARRNGGEGRNADGAANEDQPIVAPFRATHAAGHTTMPTSYIGEIKIFVYSLFASIFPSWLPPRLHEARDARAAVREHQD